MPTRLIYYRTLFANIDLFYITWTPCVSFDWWMKDVLLIRCVVTHGQHGSLEYRIFTIMNKLRTFVPSYCFVKGRLIFYEYCFLPVWKRYRFIIPRVQLLHLRKKEGSIYSQIYIFSISNTKYRYILVVFILRDVGRVNSV